MLSSVVVSAALAWVVPSVPTGHQARVVPARMMFGGGGGDQGEGGFMCASPKAHDTQSRFTTDMCVGARVQG